MNAPHIHLLVNHVPILGSAFGLFLLLLSLHPRFGANVRRAALVFFVVTGLFSILSVLSGDAAHELLHGTPGIVSANVEAHEEAADKASMVAIITGLAALLMLVMDWMGRKLPGFVPWLVYLLAILTFALMVYTGEVGGHIRHPEIVKGWTAQAHRSETGNSAAKTGETPGDTEHQHGDDD
ncbi:MAG: hypothetical protein V2A56_11990 [bacterium]